MNKKITITQTMFCQLLLRFLFNSLFNIKINKALLKLNKSVTRFASYILSGLVFIGEIFSRLIYNSSTIINFYFHKAIASPAGFKAYNHVVEVGFKACLSLADLNKLHVFNKMNNRNLQGNRTRNNYNLFNT